MSLSLNESNVSAWKYFCLLNMLSVIQGPKLTFLGRRQLATEFFLKSPCGKMWSPKSGLLRPQYDYVLGNR